MTRSDLVEVLEQEQNQLSERDVELAVKTMLERIELSVTRISQWLHHGAGGYRLALDRLAVG